MEQTEELILEPLLAEMKVKRIDLLPWWMTACCWLFLFSSVFVVIVVLMSLFGFSVSLGFYGLEATTVYSPAGCLLTVVLLLKAVVAYGLWWEKDWAVNLGIIDALSGIFICGIIMMPITIIQEFTNGAGGLRLELVASVLYLIKLQKIKPLWQKEN